MAVSLEREPMESPAAAASVSRFVRTLIQPGGARRADWPTRRYAPYAVDWRFLPEEILLIKDFIRHHLVESSNAIAQNRLTSPLWVETLGRNIARSVRKAKILFVHIPKTGGTSISRVLYNRNLPHYTAGFWYRTFGPAVANLPSFAVIRHPVERLVSAYKMAVAGGTDIVAYSRYWRARLRGLETFETFVDHLFELREHLLEAAPDLREEADFVLDPDGCVIVDRLFSLDARRGLPAELCRWLSVPDFPHLNATPALPLEVTGAAREKIEQIYPRDFQIYRHLVAAGGVADARGLRLGDAR